MYSSVSPASCVQVSVVLQGLLGIYSRVQGVLTTELEQTFISDMGPHEH